MTRLRITRSGILTLILGLGLLLAPWYVWASGGMQPAHIILTIGVVIALAWIAPSTLPEILLASYLVYAAARESIQVLYSGEIAGLLPALHVLFGYCLYVLTRRVLGLDRSPRVLAWWLLGSALFAIGGVLILGTGSIGVGAERAIGTFNNPNQLGYFGVLVSSVALLFWLDSAMSQKWMLSVLAICMYLCVLSLSKSAMASVALVPLAYIGIVSRRSTKGVFIWCIILLVGLYILGEAGVFGRFYIADFAAYNRVMNAANESDSSLAVRGYTVLADASWWQVLFGLSSQTVADLRGGYEVHSTYMAPIASYGVLGGGLFLVFLAHFNYRFVTRLGIFAYLGAVMPMMLYGIAHNGGRTPLFWIYLGVATALSSRRPGHISSAGAMRSARRASS